MGMHILRDPWEYGFLLLYMKDQYKHVCSLDIYQPDKDLATEPNKL